MLYVRVSAEGGALGNSILGWHVQVAGAQRPGRLFRALRVEAVSTCSPRHRLLLLPSPLFSCLLLLLLICLASIVRAATLSGVKVIGTCTTLNSPLRWRLVSARRERRKRRLLRRKTIVSIDRKRVLEKKEKDSTCLRVQNNFVFGMHRR